MSIILNRLRIGAISLTLSLIESKVLLRILRFHQISGSRRVKFLKMLKLSHQQKREVMEMELKAINTQTGQIFEGGLDQIVAWMETVTEDFPKVDAIANVMADMEVIPEDNDMMDEKFDEINRLGEEIGVEFLPVDEWGHISR